MNLTAAKNWKTVKLGDVADVKGGKRLPLGSDLVTTKTEHPYIRITDIQDGKIKKDQLLFVPDEVFKKISQYIVDAGDLIISIVGSVGFVAYIDQGLHKASLTENAVRITKYKDSIEPKFLFYYLLSRSGQHDLQSKTVGSTQPKLPIYNIRNIEIPLPSLEEQREIAGVLGSLDDKIGLLRKENKTLESIAQTLFKEWFVNFNFPGAIGKMIDSELGAIPVCWRVFDLREIVEVVNGYSYKGSELKEDSSQALVTLKSFDRNGGFQTRGFKAFDGIPKPEQEVKVGDLVVAHTDLTQDAEVLGNPAFIFENGGFEKMYITMDLVKIVPKVSEITNSFLYFLMQTREFKSHCVGYSNGTTVLHLSKKAIPEYKVVLPSNLILCADFSATSEKITLKISNNIVEIQTLSKLRDELLNKIFRD